MSSLLGHSHPEIVEVVQKQVATLDHLLSNMVTYPVVDLAERLASFLPAPLEKSFFLNTGGESVEAAIKIAKCYTGKFEIVAFTACELCDLLACPEGRWASYSRPAGFSSAQRVPLTVSKGRWLV
jgi:hypothetical protein